MAGGVSLGTAYVSIEASTQALGKAMQGLSGTATDEGSKSGNNFVSSFKKILARGALVVAAKKLGSAISSAMNESFEVGNTMVDYSKQLEILTGSAEASGKMISDLYAYAQGSPLDTKGVVAAAKTIAGYGVSAEEATEATRILGNISVVSGGDMQGLATVYGQVSAAGKLSAQDAIQFINQGVGIYDALSKVTGRSASDIKENLGSIPITAEQVKLALENAVPADALEQMSQSGSASVANLEDSMDSLKLAFQGVSQDAQGNFVAAEGSLNKGMTGMNNAIASLVSSPAIQGLVSKLGGTLGKALGKVAGIIESLTAKFNDMGEGGGSALSGLAATLGPVLTVLNPMKLILQALTPIFPLIIQTAQQIVLALAPLLPILAELVTNALTALVPLIVQIVGALAQLMPPIIELIQALIPPLLELFTSLSPVITGLIDAIGPVVDTLLGALIPAFDAVSGIVQSVIVPIVSVISGVFSGIMEALTGLFEFWQKIWSAIRDAFEGVWESVFRFFNTVISRIMAPVNAIKDAVSAAFEWLGEKMHAVFAGIGDFVYGIFSSMLGIIKAPINALISAINFVISKVNTISYDVPDWVPFVGGKHFGFNIPEIPALSQGATVLPHPGGTLVRLAEAGRSETVVDTGLMNRLLINANQELERGAGANEKRIEYLLERLLEKDATVYLSEQRMAVGMVGSNQTVIGTLDQISARGGASWAK